MIRIGRSPLLAAATLQRPPPLSPRSAQGDYPSRPIRIIVQTQPGGLIDQLGRAFAQKLQESGKTAIVENRTGGGGLIAAEHVAKSPPDGYTIYIGSHGTQAIHPHLTRNLPYDAARDFAPVIYLATTPTLLVVHPSVKAKSLKELIAYAKANPGKLSYGSQGTGSSGHMAGEQFKQLTGTDIVHVPYKGAAPAVQDLVAGHVSMVFDTVAFSTTQVRPAGCAGLPWSPTSACRCCPMCRPWRKRACRRCRAAPGSAWWCRQRRRVRSSTGSIARRTRRSRAKDVRERFIAQGFILPLGTPEAFGAHIAAEYKRWGEVIRRGGIKSE